MEETVLHDFYFISLKPINCGVGWLLANTREKRKFEQNRKFGCLEQRKAQNEVNSVSHDSIYDFAQLRHYEFFEEKKIGVRSMHSAEFMKSGPELSSYLVHTQFHSWYIHKLTY